MTGVEQHLYKIGIIGNGSQSKRIQKILKQKKHTFFIYKPSKPSYFDSKKFEILKKCKIIFIISPNKSHFKYLKILNKERYIFCEKPPCMNKRDLKLIKNIPYGKIFFNFNFRFSFISKILSNLNTYKLGELLNINSYITHGLAFKKEYKFNWRSKKSENQLGVLEMILIHNIDLINYIFKIKKLNSLSLKNFSKVGSSFDTCHVNYVLKNGSSASFFGSYSAPYYKKNLFIFKNGYIEQDDRKIEIRGPALNYNKKGLFIKPKLLKVFKVSEKKDFEQSLKNSVNYFLKYALKNKKFPKNMFECSLLTNNLLLEKNYN